LAQLKARTSISPALLFTRPVKTGPLCGPLLARGSVFKDGTPRPSEFVRLSHCEHLVVQRNRRRPVRSGPDAPARMECLAFDLSMYTVRRWPSHSLSRGRGGDVWGHHGRGGGATHRIGGMGTNWDLGHLLKQRRAHCRRASPGLHRAISTLRERPLPTPYYVNSSPGVYGIRLTPRILTVRRKGRITRHLADWHYGRWRGGSG